MKQFNLKQFRIKFNLTQNQVAELLNVKQAFVSQVERGLDPMPDKWLEIFKEKFENFDENDYIMYDDGISNISAGTNSGINNTINQPELISSFLTEISEQRKSADRVLSVLEQTLNVTTKQQEQISVLINSIIKNGKN